MIYFEPGEAIPALAFPISNGNAAVNADATPTVTVWRNGSLDGGVTPSVANISTGQYSFAFTVPSGYALGDVVQVKAAATVGGVVLPITPIFTFRVDRKVSSRAIAGDQMTLTSTERTTLYSGIWANATRTLTAIADSSGVTALLSRIGGPAASTVLDYLVSLENKVTAARMTTLTRLETALEETSGGSGIWRWTVSALSRVGVNITTLLSDVGATKTRVLAALPDAAPGSASGLTTVGSVASEADIILGLSAMGTWSGIETKVGTVTTQKLIHPAGGMVWKKYNETTGVLTVVYNPATPVPGDLETAIAAAEVEAGI